MSTHESIRAIGIEAELHSLREKYEAAKSPELRRELWQLIDWFENVSARKR